MAEDNSQQLERVRNRLAVSVDSKLPHIFRNLLPKLVSRFDGSTANTNNNNEHLIGIFDHVMERIQLNRSIVVEAGWVKALLQSVVAHHGNDRICEQCTLPVLEVALLECDVDSALCDLMRLFDRVHLALSAMEEQRNSNNAQAEKQKILVTSWERLSWMIVEQIARRSELRPILDWDHLGDSWDDLSASASFKRIVPYEPNDDERRAATASTFALLLDAVTFEPIRHLPDFRNTLRRTFANLNRQASSRWQFRRQAVSHAETLEQANRQRNMARQVADAQIRGNHQQRRFIHMTPRQRDPANWSETEKRYWKALQYAVKGFAVKLFSDEREEVLRIVTGQVKTIVPVYKPPPASEMYKYNARKKKKCETQNRCSLSVAIAILRFVVGDAVAMTVCQDNPAFEFQRNLFGSFSISECAQYTELPMPVADRAVAFLKQAEIETSTASTEDLKLFLILFDELHRHLPSDISVETHEQIGAQTSPAICWNVHFLYSLTLNESGEEPFKEFLAQKAWTASLRLLNDLQDVSLHRFERIRRLEAMRTTDRLIHEHRAKLALQNHFIEEAVQARTKAYQLISKYVSVERLKTSENEISWDLAIQMLNCVAFDHRDETLPALKGVSVDVISQYSLALKNFKGDIISIRLNPLLVPLLKACTSTSDWAREYSLQWASDVLYLLDPLLTHTVCSCLAGDNNLLIAERARDTLNCLTFPTMVDSTCENEITFFDLAQQNEKDAVLNDLKRRAKFLSTEFALSPRAARLVLQAFDFKEDDAFRALKEDWISTVAQSGAERHISATESGRLPDDEGCGMCEVCYEDISDDTSFALRCSHHFCVLCWKDGIAAAANEGTSALVNLTCLRHDCNERCTKEDLNLVSPESVAKVEEATLEWFILRSFDYCFCPGADCTAVAKCQRDSLGSATATCRLCESAFCFQCQEKPHRPASCEVWRQYTTESERIAAHIDGVEHKTIACPRCNVPITKNGGCNHMTCTQCGHEFCWICLSSEWQSHVCNVFDSLTGINNVDRIEFYRHRVQAHLASAEMTKRVLDDFEQSSIELQERSPFCTTKHLDILKTAWQTTIVARNYLANSYVAAFGMTSVEEPVRKEFETHQSQLQVFVEQLSFLSDTIQHFYDIKDEKDFITRFNGLRFCSVAVTGYIRRIETFMRTNFDSKSLEYVGREQ